MGNLYGYTVEKTLIQKNGIASNGNTKASFKVVPFEKGNWTDLAQNNDYAKVIKGYLYDEPITTTDTAIINNALRGRFIFSMLCADFSPEVAIGLGLSWIDTHCNPEEIYRYTVYLNDIHGKKSKISQTIAAGLPLNELVELPKNVFDADYVDSTVTLKWNIPDKTIYSAYHVERSDDNGNNFHRITESPIYPTGNGAVLDTVAHTDKVPVLFKTYIYRVRGLDPFGDESAPSNVVKVFAYQTKLEGIRNLNYSFPNDKKVLLRWKYPDSLLVNIKGFNVYRNTNEITEKVNEKMIEPYNKFVIDNIRPLDQNIIYTVSVVDLRDKEIPAEPLMVIIEDSIAPQKATNLRGFIDKNGIATIKWDKSKDIDVYSYDIFRAEGDRRNYMFTIFQTSKKDTMFVDTVSMKAYSKYVYYLVVPTDYHTNSCEKNDTLRLVRPDIYPPTPPIFDNLGYTDTTIVLSWKYSRSDDVIKYNFYKFLPPDTTKLLLSSFIPADSVLTYIDKDWEEEISIGYVLQAVDGAGLSSGDSCRTILKVPKPLRREPVNNIFANYHRKDKNVQLTWEYKARKPITKYVIMRKDRSATNFKKLLELAGTTHEYRDNSVKEEMEYEYSIFAYWADGTLSATGKTITIKVK